MIRSLCARRRSALAAIGAVTLCMASVALAETLYVDDRLQIGVHEDRQLSSTIIELLPSGTPLEVLGREASLVQVRLADGREGWVDGGFLSETPPGRGRLVELQAELDAARAQLAGAQAQVAELENQVAKRRGDSPPGSEADAIPSDTLREMQALVEENQGLKQQVAELEAVQRMAVERTEAAQQELARLRGSSAAPAAAPEEAGFRVSGWQRWQQILLASALLLAFAAGGWLVDWRIRQRHGGFRV
jgi:SH3 domain protein